jgi:hypothetical protein
MAILQSAAWPQLTLPRDRAGRRPALRSEREVMRSPTAVRNVRAQQSADQSANVLIRRLITVQGIPTPQTFPQRLNALFPSAAVGGAGLSGVPLVRALLVGATGFEPVTPSVSANRGNRCATRHSPRSPRAVDAEVKCSLDVQLRTLVLTLVLAALCAGRGRRTRLKTFHRHRRSTDWQRCRLGAAVWRCRRCCSRRPVAFPSTGCWSRHYRARSRL